MTFSSRPWIHWGQQFFQHTDHLGVCPLVVAQRTPCETRGRVLEMEWICTAGKRSSLGPGVDRGEIFDICVFAYWVQEAGWESARNMQIMKNVSLQFTSSSQHWIPPVPHILVSQSFTGFGWLWHDGWLVLSDNGDQSPVSTIASHGPGCGITIMRLFFLIKKKLAFISFSFHCL